MSGTQNDYPFTIWHYTIPGAKISNSAGAPGGASSTTSSRRAADMSMME
ncbi:MAG: hypothetical protein LGL72_07865 [Acidibrevibacterium sp.]|jgi:hypothetical protein|nr:hypothetical protein [Acidibrevibacterium fodinaquatile]MCA7119309.1 hypothetical protein [Acidibrevibacterium fodinaquatile]